MVDGQEILTREQRDVLPKEAQQLYVDVYTRRWQEYDAKRDGPMSRDTVASIAAMSELTRQYERDEKTFRWHRKVDHTPREEAPRSHSHSIPEFLKGIFRRNGVAVAQHQHPTSS